MYDTYNPIKADGALVGVFFLISFPAVITTAILTKILKTEHPQWCDETINFMGTLAFVLLNCVYWMFLAHLIEIAHTNYRRKRSEPEKPYLRIFSGLRLKKTYLLKQAFSSIFRA